MNTPSNYYVGQRFAMSGVEFEIAFIDALHIRYSSVVGGKILQLTFYKFQALLDNGSLSLVGPKATLEKLPNMLTKEETSIMNRKLNYVREVLTHIECPTSKNRKKEVRLVLEKVSKETSDSKIPSHSSISRWIKLYVSSNNNPISLAPKVNEKGNRTRRLDPIIEALIESRIYESFLSKQRLSSLAIHALIIGDILLEYGDSDNKNKLPAHIKLPSKRSIRTRIAKLDPYKRSKYRNGKYIANRAFKAAGKGTIATRALETIEADGNILDVLIVDDETGEVIGRPCGTCLIDKYSRCIISFVITMIPFSSATLLKALKIAISGNNGRHGGLFESMIVDNGSDYISSSVRNFCNNTGVRIEHGAPRDPNSKPHVERFFGTLNKQLVHILPGTTFSNPSDKGDYKSEKFACLTLEDLNKYIEQWIDTIYHKTVHRGHGRAPEMLWKDSIKDNPIITYPIEHLDTIAREVYQRRISKGRVTVHNLQWYSHALATVEQDCKNKGIPAQVDVYVDSLDLGRVYVRDPRDHSVFIQADAVFPNYAEGLSLYEHEIIRANLKGQGKKDLASYGAYYLEIAKWELYEKITKDSKEYAKKKRARIKETNKKIKEAKRLKNKIKQLKTIKSLNKTPKLKQNTLIPPRTPGSSNKNGSDDSDSFTFERF